MMTNENKLTDEQLTQVAGGKGYEKDDEVIVISGLNISISKAELVALAAKDPEQLTTYEKAILQYAKNAKLI